MVRVTGITPSVYAALLMRVACCPVELRDGMLTRLQDLDACWCLLAVSWIAQETLLSPQEILEVGKSFTRKHVGYKVRASSTRFGPALLLEGAMGGKGDPQ